MVAVGEPATFLKSARIRASDRPVPTIATDPVGALDRRCALGHCLANPCTRDGPSLEDTLPGPDHHRRQPLDVVDDLHSLEHLTTLGARRDQSPATKQIFSYELVPGVPFHQGIHSTSATNTPSIPQGKPIGAESGYVFNASEHFVCRSAPAHPIPTPRGADPGAASRPMTNACA